MAIVMDQRYRELNERFPLRPIKTHEEFKEAQALLIEIGLKSEFTPNEEDYFVVLSRLVGDYELTLPGVQKLLADAAAITGRELLEGLLEDNGIGQRELSRQLEIPQSHISEYLAGKRGLSKQNALKIAKHFGLPVEKFLQ